MSNSRCFNCNSATVIKPIVLANQKLSRRKYCYNCDSRSTKCCCCRRLSESFIGRDDDSMYCPLCLKKHMPEVYAREYGKPSDSEAQGL